jgi:hypothetical protein
MRRHSAAIFLVLLIACDRQPPSRPEDKILWETTPEPILTIGLEDGDPAYLFTRVAGVGRLSNGTIVVAESDTREIRLYRPDGTHIRSVGGQGGGPGEFSHTLSEIQIAAGDTILAFQSFDLPWVMRYAPNGDYIDQWRLETRRAWRPGLNMENDYELLPDGRLAFELDSMLEEPQRGRPTWKLTLVIDRNHRIDTLGWFPGAPRGLRHFAAQRGIRDRRGRIILINPEQSTIWSFDPLTLQADTITWTAVQRMPVTDSMKESLKARTRSLNPGMTDEVLESVMEGLDLVDSLPQFMDVLIDVDGNYWVSEPRMRGDSTQQHWVVRNPRGTVLGSARVAHPPRDIGADYMLTVKYDENRVPYVHVYGLKRVAAPSR